MCLGHNPTSHSRVCMCMASGSINHRPLLKSIRSGTLYRSWPFGLVNEEMPSSLLSGTRGKVRENIYGLLGAYVTRGRVIQNRGQVAQSKSWPHPQMWLQRLFQAERHFGRVALSVWNGCSALRAARFSTKEGASWSPASHSRSRGTEQRPGSCQASESFQKKSEMSPQNDTA